MERNKSVSNGSVKSSIIKLVFIPFSFEVFAMRLFIESKTCWQVVPFGILISIVILHF